MRLQAFSIVLDETQYLVLLCVRENGAKVRLNGRAAIQGFQDSKEDLRRVVLEVNRRALGPVLGAGNLQDCLARSGIGAVLRNGMLVMVAHGQTNLGFVMGFVTRVRVAGRWFALRRHRHVVEHTSRNVDSSNCFGAASGALWTC